MWRSLIASIWPWGRERIAEEKRADELFKAQVKEAFLSQQDLLEAVAQMKKTREDQEAVSVHFRRDMQHSRPSIP